MAVNPKDLEKTLKNLGSNSNKKLSFFKIPISKLDISKIAVYLFRKEPKKGWISSELREDDLKKFYPKNIKKYSIVPYRSKVYFKEHVKNGSYLLFVGIPHILYKGNIDVSDCKKINITV